MKNNDTRTMYRRIGMGDGRRPNLVTKIPDSSEMKRNWKKVMIFPELGSSLMEGRKEDRGGEEERRRRRRGGRGGEEERR